MKSKVHSNDLHTDEQDRSLAEKYWAFEIDNITGETLQNVLT